MPIEPSRAQGLEIGWDPAAIFTVDKVFHGRAGQSGNPAGRAKSFDAADEFIRPLDQQRVHRVSNIGEIGNSLGLVGSDELVGS